MELRTTPRLLPTLFTKKLNTPNSSVYTRAILLLSPYFSALKTMPLL